MDLISHVAIALPDGVIDENECVFTGILIFDMLIAEKFNVRIYKQCIEFGMHNAFDAFYNIKYIGPIYMLYKWC